MSEQILYHHGIVGQKWGRRRWQNKDGSLTPAGYIHYGYAKNVTRMTKSSITGKWKSKKIKDRYVITPEGVSKFMSDKELAKKAENYIESLKKTTLMELKLEKNLNSNDEIEYVNLDRPDNKPHIIEKNGKYILPKGKEFQRITNTKETVDTRPKYVTFLPDDNEQYQIDHEFFVFKGDPVLEKYAAKKNLNLATSKTVTESLLKKIGDKKVSDYAVDVEKLFKFTKDGDMNAYINKEALNNQKMAKELYDMKIKDLLNSQYAVKGDKYKVDKEQDLETALIRQYVSTKSDVGYKVAKNVVQNVMFTNKSMQSKIIKDLAKQGYDAIVDIEDAFGYGRYPIILTNPSNSVRKTKSVDYEKWWTKDQYEGKKVTGSRKPD